MTPESTFAYWRGFLYRRAENVLAAMLGVMFAAFLLQIAFRYLTDWSTGWAGELSTLLWIWLILFGAAFVLREEEEIRFDLVYGAVGVRARRIMLVLGGLALIGLYGASLPAVVDYVTFMRVEKSAYLKFRLDFVFVIYVVFVVAILVRYLVLCWRLMRGAPPPQSNIGAESAL
jgi:TRAP-type C4-dicarboxylate transport system permease small subunit